MIESMAKDDKLVIQCGVLFSYSRYTVCPKSRVHLYIVSIKCKLDETSWTDRNRKNLFTFRFLKDVKFMINIQLGLYWRKNN